MRAFANDSSVIVALQQRSDQAHELLLLRSLSAGEEGSHLEVLNISAGGHIGFVPNEHHSCVVADQIPAVAAWAFIELPRFLHDDVLPASRAQRAGHRRSAGVSSLSHTAAR